MKKIDYTKHGYYKIRAVSPKLALANPIANAEVIVGEANLASKGNCVAIVFPELNLTGYSCEDLFLGSELLAEVEKATVLILKKTQELDVTILFGAPYLHEDGRLYNGAYVCNRGKIIGIIPKSFLPNYKEFYEKRWFSQGLGLKNCEVYKFNQTFTFGPNQIFSIKDLRFGVEICEDLWSPLPPSNNLAIAGALAIFNLSASNELVTKYEYRKDLIKVQSARLQCAYIYANAGIMESTKDIVFGGNLLAYENGSLISEGERFCFETTRIDIEVDTNKLVNERLVNKTYSDCVVQNAVKVHQIKSSYMLKTLERTYPEMPFVPSGSNQVGPRVDEILAIQSAGLARRILASRSKAILLGLSGGLDSTLAFLVCLDALRKLDMPVSTLRCITMPGFGTSVKTKSSAYALAESCGASIDEISIDGSVRSHFNDIGHDEKILNNVYENAQARERTQILFDLANKYEGIVCGTGDLSEQVLGWCTYNGDQMSNYNVNTSIPKTLVKFLIEGYAKKSNNDKLKKVLKKILETTISPELIPMGLNNKMQSTEDLVGPYLLHDFFIFHLLRNGFSLDKIYILATKTFKEKFSEKEILKWIKVFATRFSANQFKRTTLPPGPKVGSVSVSPRGDLRLPDEFSYNFIPGGKNDS